MILDDELAQLHILRTRGHVLREQVTDPGTMAGLEHAGLVLENRQGYLLTPAGYRRHQGRIATLRSASVLDEVHAAYETVRTINPVVEDACVAWQLSARDVETAREISRMLQEGLAGATRSLGAAGDAVPHLQPYPGRLTAALTMAEHDRRFLTSPGVDSFHAVWFQLEEDLLVTLGLERPEDEELEHADLLAVLPSTATARSVTGPTDLDGHQAPRGTIRPGRRGT